MLPKDSPTCSDCGAEIRTLGRRCRSCARKREQAAKRADIAPPNPSGLCLCGCGQTAPIATQSNRRSGWLKDHPQKYILGHRIREPRDWSGGLVEGTDYRVEDRGHDTLCWIWLRHKAGGYGIVSVNGKHHLAHRFFYEMMRGPIPPGLEPDHLCRQTDCINPDHLEPVTRAVNAQRGARTKLTPVEVLEIRALAGAIGTAELGRRYGVGQRAIYYILNRQTWNNV